MVLLYGELAIGKRSRRGCNIRCNMEIEKREDLTTDRSIWKRLDEKRRKRRLPQEISIFDGRKISWRHQGRAPLYASVAI